MATLKLSTAYTRAFLMVQTADHISGLTGASPTVNISKAGAAFGAAAGTVTEIANGWYKCALTTADTGTLGDLAFHITAASGDPTDFVDQVTSNILGDTLPANLTQVNAHAVTDTASGVIDVNAKNLGGTAQTGRDIGASVLLSAGTGTGQLDFTSGVVKANLAQILGTALTETAGQIAAAFKQFFNIASPTSTMNTITTVTTATTATNLTNAPTAGDFTATMKTSLNAATPASVTGAVGSVTGAVGSVTGNVGGNVTGSVGSVAAGVTVTTNNDKTGYTVSTVSDKTGYRLDATGSAAMTESYSAKGATQTLPQILYEIRAILAEKSVTGTTATINKLDGVTAAESFALNDGTSPTAITRAT